MSPELERSPMPAVSPQKPCLRLMLDSAEVRQWEEWFAVGLLYGVTTNPLLLQRAQVPCQVPVLKALAVQALQMGAQEVQLQAWGNTVERYLQTGQALGEIDPRVVVKVPATRIGTTAAVRLLRQGIRVTLTGVYGIPQVIVAAAIGADYAAPYLGRIHDLGRNGCEDLIAMQRALEGIESATRLLVASIRRAADIAILAAHKLNTFTISTVIAEELFNVRETLKATADFEQAAQQPES